jgi:preprotein translocase subunit SecF
VNRSMNLVLSRSLNTSLTSLLTVGSILFVGSFVLGATTLQDFALALFVGLAASTYSSIFVAAPLLATWKEKEEAWAGRRRKIEGRLRAEAEATGPSPRRPAAASSPRVVTRPPPRPPKKRSR